MKVEGVEGEGAMGLADMLMEGRRMSKLMVVFMGTCQFSRGSGCVLIVWMSRRVMSQDSRAGEVSVLSVRGWT